MVANLIRPMHRILETTRLVESHKMIDKGGPGIVTDAKKGKPEHR